MGYLIVLCLCWFCVFLLFFLTHENCCNSSQCIILQGGHFQHLEAKFGFLPLFFLHFFAVSKKNSPLFEKAKTSGCTLANLVISERIQTKAGPIPSHCGFSMVSASSTSIPTITLGASGLFSDLPNFLAGIQHLVVENSLSQLCLFVQVTSAMIFVSCS